ncbi:MAG: hypothetical protein NTV62_00600, partial [Candidatus Gribaldobacteria bacterium]|nr:hypothetical protein [Candidatus Gribaldobacteria bacterium]
AYQFAEAGAAEVVSEENLTPHFFLEKLRFLIERPDILKTMAVNSKAFSRTKTASIIANYLLDYLYQTLET